MEILKILLAGGLLTTVTAIIANAFGLIRFRGKDKADVSKVISETEVVKAEARSKAIDDEIKVSKISLEWTSQFAAELVKANMINERRQLEIDRLHNVILTMREEFEKKMDEVEMLLEQTREECREDKKRLQIEKEKNEKLIAEINKHIGTGKTE